MVEARWALLAWATDQQSWIVEDDCNSEYRHAGRPLPALQGLDACGRVLYQGTFSNILFPALRMGYLVVPPSLVETLVTVRRGVDLHSSAREQTVVADFIMQGHFVRHIRRMRTLYAHRQAVLRTAIGHYLSGVLEVHPDPAGMHLVTWLLFPGAKSEAIVEAAGAGGLELLPLSFFSIRPLCRQGLVLGYAACNDDQILEGVRTLCSVVERTLKHPLYNLPWEA